jgi:cell division protein ZapB
VFGQTYNLTAMAENASFDQLADRIDRLLLRHEEAQRTNDLLRAEVKSLQSERDLLRSRLGAARARIDTLLERISHTQASAPETTTEQEAPR